jgi:hypothetical protein
MELLPFNSEIIRGAIIARAKKYGVHPMCVACREYKKTCKHPFSAYPYIGEWNFVCFAKHG